MKHLRSAFLFCVLAVLLGSLPGRAVAQVDNELIVRFTPNIIQIDTLGNVTINHSGIDSVFTTWQYNSFAMAWPTYDSTDTLHNTIDGRIIKLPDWSDIFRIELLSTEYRDTVMARLNMYEDVLFVHPNTTCSVRSPNQFAMLPDSRLARPFHYLEQSSLQMTPDDPLYQYQWNLHGTYGIDADETWDVTTGASSTFISFTDDYLDPSHPDFSSRLQPLSTTGDRHANLVAGVAIAELDNDEGISGIDAAAEYFGYSTGSAKDIVASALAIRRSYVDGAHIINCSWGIDPPNGTSYEGSYPTLGLEMASAYRAGAVVIAADRETGHIGEYPARYGRQGMVVTGATGADGYSADYFDGYGSDATDFCAPGGHYYHLGADVDHEITSTWTYSDGGQTKYYDQFMGTSAAAPHATGVCGLIRSPALENDLNDELDPEDYEEIMRITCKDHADQSPSQYEYGAGIVDAGAAVEFMQTTQGEPNRCMKHYTESLSGGTATQIESNQWCLPVLQWMDAWYILDRFWYVCDVYKVERTVTFPASYQSTPEVWGRGKGAYGYSLDRLPMVPKMYTEVVPGSVSATGATLRTYVFKLKTYYSHTFQGWLPCHPDDVKFAYTVVGDVVEPNEKSLSVRGPECMSLKEPLTWHAHVNFAEEVSYLWEIELSPGSGTWLTIGTQQSCSRLGGYNDFNIRCTVTFASSPYTLTETVSVDYDPACNMQLIKRATDVALASSSEIELFANYPNPFNPSTMIPLRVSSSAGDANDYHMVDIKLYDLYGKEVDVIYSGVLSSGYHEIPYASRGLASGVYIYRVSTAGMVKSGRLVLAK